MASSEHDCSGDCAGHAHVRLTCRGGLRNELVAIRMRARLLVVDAKAALAVDREGNRHLQRSSSSSNSSTRPVSKHSANRRHMLPIYESRALAPAWLVHGCSWPRLGCESLTLSTSDTRVAMQREASERDEAERRWKELRERGNRRADEQWVQRERDKAGERKRMGTRNSRAERSSSETPRATRSLLALPRSPRLVSTSLGKQR